MASEITDEAAANIEGRDAKPVDPKVLEAAAAREKARLVLSATMVSLTEALQAWFKGGPADVVGEKAADWMVAQGSADMTEVPSSIRLQFRHFEREHHAIVDAAKEKALAILIPANRRASTDLDPKPFTPPASITTRVPVEGLTAPIHNVDDLAAELDGFFA